jgi:radical SAM superfamily enzyme YgiQ (UPF0313 family)
MYPVLLVFPPPSEEQADTISPPLSILYVGAHLERAGVSVSYVDLRVQPLQTLLDELDKGPSLVGVSSMTGFQLVGTMDVLETVKKRQPGIKTVLGGVHASLLPEQTLSDPLVDFVVIGEGEITLLELVQELKSKKEDLSNIMGVGWKKKDGSIVINGQRPFMNMADAVAPITQSSLHLYQYYPIGKTQVARGCPFHCAFCYNTVFNRRKYRQKPLEVIEAEIRIITKMAPHVKHISLLADEIGFNHKRIVSMAKLTAKFGYSFHTAIRAENVDEKLVTEIDNICEELFIGVEHVSPRIRKMICKDNNVDDITQASQVLARSKIRPVWSFMTAFPEETREETLANMDYADMLRVQNPRSVISPFFLTTPFPGTELYVLAQKYGYRPPKDLRDWRDFGLGKVTMPWIDAKAENFSDLYGMSCLLFTSEKSYRRSDFEMQWFSYLKETAWQRWKARDIRFKREWEMFLAYNRCMKVIPQKIL